MVDEDPARQGSRSSRLSAWFSRAGDVLLLQLLFAIVALPVLTLFPAAVALQRSLRDAFVEGRPHLAADFLANLRWAFSRTWKVAALLPIVAVAAVVSLFFWSAAIGPAGIVASVILFPLYGLALAGYAALLAASMWAPRAAGLRVWLDGARQLVAGRPLRLAGAVVVMATWFLLLLRVPTLALIGTGLVPSALAWWMALDLVNQRRNELNKDNSV